MKIISLFDATISDYNLGNEIIVDSVYKHLREMFPDDFFYKLPCMEITSHTIQYIRSSDFVFFGGTNVLSSRMERYKQWGINFVNSFFIDNIILMGVGWWQYQQNESIYTRFLLRQVLNRTFSHSVRDSYTEKKLKGLGFSNVINTGCPSLWDLSSEHCVSIRQDKSTDVIMTFTDYNKDPERDIRLFEEMKKLYRNVYVWIQGVGDREYVNHICGSRAIIVAPNLKALDDVLASRDVDYVGTRLHAGIRALQHRRRTFIVAVDNRALEMKKDFALPVVTKEEIVELGNMIRGTWETRISLPCEQIAQWKAQFVNAAVAPLA